MANMMQFGDFNPLDMLATAASLQTAKLDSDSGGENGGDQSQGNSGQEASEEGAEKEGDMNKDKKSVKTEKAMEEGSEIGTDIESAGFVTDLSSPISDTLGSPFSEGEVFTPPPPVAPLSPGPACNKSSSDALKPPCVIKLLDTGANREIKPSTVSLKDTTKIVLPTKQGPKTMTVLKINKQQVSDHSYAFLCQLQKLKTDEDEGYSSRSSVESEGEGDGTHNKTKSIGMCSPPISRTANASAVQVPTAGKSQPKIVIVGKDGNLQRILSSDQKKLISDLGGASTSSSSNLVLRTLLGQDRVVSPASTSKGKSSRPLTSVCLLDVSQNKDKTVTKSLKSLPLKGSECQGVENSSLVVQTSGEEPNTAAKTVLHFNTKNDAKHSPTSDSQNCAHENNSNSDHTVKSISEPVTIITFCEKPLDCDKLQKKSNAPFSQLSAESPAEKSGASLSIKDSADVACNKDIPFVSLADTSASAEEVTISVTIPGKGVNQASGSNIKLDESVSCETKEVTKVEPCPECDAELPNSASETIDPLENKDPDLETENKAMNSNNSNQECPAEQNSNLETKTSECDKSISLDSALPAESLLPEAPPCGSSSVIQNSNTTLPETGVQKIEGNGITESSESSNKDATLSLDNLLPPIPCQDNVNIALCGLSNSDSNSDSLSPSSETVSNLNDPPCENQLDVLLAEEKTCVQKRSLVVTETTEGEASQEQEAVDNLGLKTKSGVVTSKNQYIIEDDVPPVTKFSNVEANSSAKLAPVPTDHAVTNTTSTTSLEVMKLLGKPTISLPSTSVAAPISTSKIMQKGAAGNIIHVIPVSNAPVGGQATAASAVQYITRVPGKLTPCTIPTTVLVPVTAAHPQAVKLAAIPRNSTMPTAAVPGLRLITGSPAASHNITRSPVPTDSSSSSPVLQSEPSSPYSRLGSPILGKEGSSPEVGRQTPEVASSPMGSLDKSPNDVINVKITGGQIQTEKTFDERLSTKKGPLSIGKMGSLSWKPLEKSSELVRLDQVAGSLSGRQRLRIQGSEISSKVCLEDGLPDESESSHSPVADLGEENSKDTVGSDDTPSEQELGVISLKPQAANRTVHSYVRRNRKAHLGTVLSPNGNEPDMSVMRKSALSMSHLHPLIDHDYCMFTEFNAQIQSSIIATTECKTKTERKYTKKSKAARTNVAKTSNTVPCGMEKVDKVREPAVRVGRGRPKKRAPEPEPEMDGTLISSPVAPEVSKADEAKIKKQTMAEKKAMERSKRVLRDGRHYVKITGSYQDEFVYFATKKTRGRRGNQSDAQPNVPAQPAAVGGISVFDWYKDLSNSDKGSRFGIHSSNDTETTSVTSDVDVPSASGLDSLVQKPTGPDQTPIHESDVVDLVCELSGLGGSGSADKEASPSSFITNDQNLGVARMEETTGPEKLDMWAEQLSTMLTSMNEDEKQQLFEQLGDSAANSEIGLEEHKVSAEGGLRDTSFDSYLSDFQQETNSSQGVHPVSSQLCDLDDINNDDLIPTEFGNMNAILGDLKSSDPTQKLDQSAGASPKVSSLLDSSTTPHVAFNMKLDKSELFPDMTTPEQQPPTPASSAAPELTVVSMYWNDLPGLIIDQKEHVRLVDIHKQVLPAKDTGILKKRCQMMGLEILNCSELQRDFLVRYANAAKSKSTVIISKESAKTLIGFYVDPKPKVSKQTSEEQKDPKETDVNKKEGVVSEESSLPTMVTDAEPLVKEEVPCEPESEVLQDPVMAFSAESNASGKIKLEGELKSAPVKSEGGKGKSRKRKVTNEFGEDDANSRVKEPWPAAISTSSKDMRNPLPVGDLKRSARLKHKKVRYDKMVQGNHYIDENDNEETMEDSPEPIPPKRRRIVLNKLVSKESDDSEISEDHENRDITGKTATFLEEAEMRKLWAKSRRKKLSKKEKKRLRRLREKIRRKEKRLKLKVRVRPPVKTEEKKLAMKITQKSKRKLQETHVYTKKYNQEHCYAACPEEFKKEEHIVEEQEEDINSPPVVVEHIPQLPCIESIKSEEELLSVQEQPKDVEDEEEEQQADTVNDSILEVVHRDTVHGNQKAMSQDGDLHLDMFTTSASPCIRCLQCDQFLSLRSFIKHMHVQEPSDDGSRNRLLEVTLPQKLELRRSRPTDRELAMWDQFQLLQKNHSQQEREAKSGRNMIAKKVEVVKTLEPSTPKLEAPEVDSTPMPSDASPASSATRHSTRVRKRKQLHPIEKYIFSKIQPESPSPPSKRSRCDTETELQDQCLNELEAKLVPSEVKSELEKMGKRLGMSVSPVRAVRVKKDPEDDRQVISKYALRVGAAQTDVHSTPQTRRQKVLTRRNRNVDTPLTITDQDKD